MRILICFLVLACSVTPACGGSILVYEWHSTIMASNAGEMIVDASVLDRGLITTGDITHIGFDMFSDSDFYPIAVPISPQTYLPYYENNISASRDVYGTIYSLRLQFGGDDDYWGVSAGGGGSIYGLGYWTVRLAQAPSIPEPSTLIMLIIGLIIICIWRRHGNR